MTIGYKVCLPNIVHCDTCRDREICQDKKKFVKNYNMWQTVSFADFIQENGGWRFWKDDVWKLQRLHFRWQEALYKYKTYPKKRTCALRCKVNQYYKKFKVAVTAARCF